MIQSIDSDLYSPLKVSSTSGSTTAKTSSSSSDLTASSQVPKTDTVEISEQARQAMQQSKVAAANTEQSVQADAAQQKAAAAAESSTKAAASSATAAQQQSNKSDAAVLNSASSSASTGTETSSTTESPVLSTLTEAQLDKLVSSGTITSTQKNAELARRAAAEAQKSASNDSNQKSISKVQEQGIESYKQQAAYGVGATTESHLLDSVA